jgi:hypothetical protein
MASLQELRDELISRALVGEIDSKQAEAEAAASGLPPLASQPDPQKFDPMKESRWPLTQVIAWISWRNFRLVMEQSAEYRANSTHWIFREWNKPDADGKKFTGRNGWFLTQRGPSGMMHLTLLDAHMRDNDSLPQAARMRPSDARDVLWQALSENKLLGEAFDRSGALIEIPARQWCRLEIFEERSGDVLKYNFIDKEEPFTEVRFRRADVMHLWPQYVAVDIAKASSGYLTDHPLELLLSNVAYVPLSLAVCWVATAGGTNQISLEDQNSWKSASEKLMDRISDGSIEIVGRDAEQMTQALPRTAFVGLDVPHPFSLEFEHILSEVTHINCYFFEDRAAWAKSFSDEYHLARKPQPIWTHLQVKRDQVLKLWPKPSASARAKLECKRWLMEQMQRSPLERPKPKTEYKREAIKRFSKLTERQFFSAWDGAIEESAAPNWAKPGRPRQKSNHRSK